MVTTRKLQQKKKRELFLLKKHRIRPCSVKLFRLKKQSQYIQIIYFIQFLIRSFDDICSIHKFSEIFFSNTSQVTICTEFANVMLLSIFKIRVHLQHLAQKKHFAWSLKPSQFDLMQPGFQMRNQPKLMQPQHQLLLPTTRNHSRARMVWQH